MRPRDQRAQRRKVSLTVTFWRRGDASDYRTGRILNMSETGAYIETDVPFPPPTIVELQVMLNEEPVRVQAEVFRSIGGTQFASASDDSGMAVRFREPDSSSATKLTRHGLDPT